MVHHTFFQCWSVSTKLYPTLSTDVTKLHILYQAGLKHTRYFSWWENMHVNTKNTMEMMVCDVETFCVEWSCKSMKTKSKSKSKFIRHVSESRFQSPGQKRLSSRNLKGETALHGILSSRMEGIRCTSRFFSSWAPKKKKIQCVLPFAHELICIYVIAR